jgi:catechol 2,3-dioxygenase-like lactoylglutathione lyase family enzyme
MTMAEELSIQNQITFLYTKDLTETHQFYSSVMGFPLVLDQGVCLIYRTSQGGFLGFCQKGSIVEVDPNVILTLVTPDVDKWFELLVTRGVKFIKKPELNPEFNIYHCMFHDPNGYLIEIQTFMDPNWQY